MTKVSAPEYDVFLSYSWRDHAAVEGVARFLREHGVKVFLDRWYLTPGRPWPEALESVLKDCRAVAVFHGPHGMGPWQQREKNLALDRQTREPAFPVIPVLLPGADPALGFLSLNTWVDLRSGLDDKVQLAILPAAVRGEPPGPELQAQVAATLATVCPYRGLHPFREEDEPFFCGREVFTERLVETVNRHALVAVVGASGSGKSSVVRAGLIPRLRRGEGSRVWDVATLVPGDRPLHAVAAALIPLLEPELSEIDRLVQVGKLADYLTKGDVALRDVAVRALEKQPGTDHLLLVVDQWEELYTLTRDDKDRQRFVENLLEAVEKGVLTLVLTLRGDFFGHALGFRPLADRLQEAVVSLGPMTREELRRAVEAPAEKVGLRFEPGLAERILDDVGNEPGNLPLLEFALTQLWDKRCGGRLLHTAYDEIGAVQGAVAFRADEVFDSLTEPERETARRVFIQLVRPGEGTEDTRRRAALGMLDEAAQQVVRKLADARLVVTGQDETTREEVVEVAHEALIRGWERLRHWVEADRAFLLWREGLQPALKLYEGCGRCEEALLHGLPLAQAVEWAKQRPLDLGPGEAVFIAASARVEEKRRRRRRRRRQGLFAALVAVIAIISALGLVAYHQREMARAQYLASQSRLVFENEPLLGLRLALEGLARVPRSETDIRDSVLGWLRELARQGRLLRFSEPVETIFASTDGSRFILLSRGEGQLRRTVDGSLITPLAGEVSGVEFVPESTEQFLLITYRRGPAELRRTTDGSLVASLKERPLEVNFGPGPSPAYFEVRYSGGYPSELRRTDTDESIPLSGRLSKVFFMPGPEADYFVVSYHDVPSELRRIADAQVIEELADRVSLVQFSRDPGKTYVVIHYRERPAEIRHAADGSMKAVRGAVANVSFGRTPGSYFVVRYADAPGELYRTADGSLVTTLAGRVSRVIFSPDPEVRYVVIDYVDAPGELRRSADGSVIQTFAYDIKQVHFSQEASYLVVGYQDDARAGELRRSADGSVVGILAGTPDRVIFNPGPVPTYFAVSYSGSAGELRRTHDGSKVTSLSQFKGLAFSRDPNTRYFVVEDEDGSRVGYHTADGSRIQFPVSRTIRHVEFSPDPHATYMILNHMDGHVELHSTVEGWIGPFTGQVRWAAFSPDAAYFVVDYADAPGELRRTADGAVVTVLKDRAHVAGVDFTPDPTGRHFVVYYSDGSPEVRRIADGSVAATLPNRKRVVELDFGTADRFLVIRYDDAHSELWGSAEDEARRLTSLGQGRKGHFFGLQDQRSVIWYSDGRAYLLDLAWLQAMDGAADTLPAGELERLACQGSLATGLLGEPAVAPYLKSGSPQACR